MYGDIEYHRNIRPSQKMKHRSWRQLKGIIRALPEGNRGIYYVSLDSYMCIYMYIQHPFCWNFSMLLLYMNLWDHYSQLYHPITFLILAFHPWSVCLEYHTIFSHCRFIESRCTKFKTPRRCNLDVNTDS